MTTDQWRRVESLCHAALARPAAERAAFLADACGNNRSLREEVESLIAESVESFLETPAVDVAPPRLLVGRRLGAYRIEARIGAGGMGEVYRAKDLRLGRDVAVKILPEAWAADPKRRIRFEREARAVAALNHPNICIIHDVGHDDGIDFLVMELVDGESLATRLANGPLPLDEALARAIEIAGALESAHQHGIVHRDLKPGNVMLAQTGSDMSHAVQAKLLDFGLARVVPSEVTHQIARTGSTPTSEVGAVLGTLQYMAPEQIEGRPADARTDVFAFGLLFHEMLTARPAFDGASTAAVIAAILREDPPRVHPREVDRVLRRCLAKDPLRRYQSARDLLNDLEEVRQGLDSAQLTEERSERRRTGRFGVWLAAVLLVAVAVGGYVGTRRPSAPAMVRGERFQLQPPPGVQILPSGSVSVLAVSPDGQWVAFRGISRQQNEAALYLRSIRELEAKKVAIAGQVPFFSADSRWLGFFAENGMFKVPVDGGRPQQICPVPNIMSVRGVSWGDRETIVFSIGRVLWRVSSEGGEPVQLTHSASNRRHYWPCVLPGSNAAVLAINQGVSDRWRQLGVVSLKTGEFQTFLGLSGTAPRYVSSGHLVYSRFGSLHAAPFDLSRLEVTGEAVKVLDDINVFGGSGSAAFDISKSGSLVYISGPASERTPEGELVWLDRQGKVAVLEDQRRRYLGAALDAEAKRLVVSIGENLGEGDLALYEIDRGAWTRLTTGMQTAGALVWSPDEKWIFFTSFRSGEGKLFRMPSRGGTPEQLTFDLDGSWDYPASVSPDGSTIAYWNVVGGQGNLMTLRLDPRGTPQPLTVSPTYVTSSGMVSPNGRWMAYDSDESGSRQIHVRPFVGAGESIRVSPNGGMNPKWSRDGRELLYERGQEVWSVTIHPGDSFRFRYQTPRLLFKTDFLGQLESHITSGVGTDRLVAVRRKPPAPVDRMLVYVPNWIDELTHALRQQPH